MDMKEHIFRADSHIHSEFSPDSVCPVSEIEKTAQEKGLNLVCITDHCDLRPGDERIAVLERQKNRVRDIRAQLQNPNGLQTLVGIELGGGFLLPELAAEVIGAEDYDVVIGSVHGIMFRGERQSTSHFDFGAVSEADVMEYLDGYLNAEQYVAEKLDVDVLAHLPYIFRYINGKYGWNLDWHIREDKLRQILSTVIDRGIVLEINTACWEGVYEQQNLEKEVVELYLDMGGKDIILGSDAHKSLHIGRQFDRAIEFLRSKGVDHLVYFANRKKHRYPI
jgi:histidinol-phosphatase (PHP family)